MMSRSMTQLPNRIRVASSRLTTPATCGRISCSPQIATSRVTKPPPGILRRYSGGPSRSESGEKALFSWPLFGVLFGIGAVGGFLVSKKIKINVQFLDQPTADTVSSTAGSWTNDAITERLNSEAYVEANPSSGVAALHITRLESSSPCEDRYIHGQNAWGVLDGHAGSQTAALLTKKLLPFVQDALSQLPSGSTNETLEKTIREAFVALDDSIVKGAVEAAKSDVLYHERVAALMPAFSGSCALLSLLDPSTWTLRVACVGDSRAVLGQQNADGNWSATALSVDQTGSNEDEIARINAEHPGENGIVKDGRVLGIMVSRGFGDGRWKWDLDFQKELKENYDGFNPLSPEKYPVKTPPYLTAEPVVTTTKLDKQRPSFLIMASDGFWDRVSNEQAVNLVAQWLETHAADGQNTKARTSLAEPEHERFDVKKHRQGEPGFQFVEERTTIQDDNVAVHLVRNALGGNFKEMVLANLGVEPPFSRYMKDDTTVQVIFFDPKMSKR